MSRQIRYLPAVELDPARHRLLVSRVPEGARSGQMIPVDIARRHPYRLPHQACLRVKLVLTDGSQRTYRERVRVPVTDR